MENSVVLGCKEEHSNRLTYSVKFRMQTGTRVRLCCVDITSRVIDNQPGSAALDLGIVA